MRGATGSRVELSYGLSADESLSVWPTSVHASVPCSDVALVPTTALAVGAELPEAAAMLLVKAKLVPLTLEPRGQAVAWLSLNEPLCVGVLQSHAGNAQISITNSNDTLIGWVAEGALQEPGDLCGQIGLLGHGAGMAPGSGFHDLDSATCPFGLPLGVQQGSARAVVGRVRAHTTLLVRTRRTSDIVVEFQHANPTPEEGAVFWISQSALEGCKVRRAKPALSERAR